MSPSRTAQPPAAIIEALLADTPPLLRVPEAAEILRCSDRQVRRLIATGRLRAARIVPGGSSAVLIPRSALEALIVEAMR